MNVILSKTTELEPKLCTLCLRTHSCTSYVCNAVAQCVCVRESCCVECSGPFRVIDVSALDCSVSGDN